MDDDDVKKQAIIEVLRADRAALPWSARFMKERIDLRKRVVRRDRRVLDRITLGELDRTHWTGVDNGGILRQDRAQIRLMLATDLGEAHDRAIQEPIIALAMASQRTAGGDRKREDEASSPEGGWFPACRNE